MPCHASLSHHTTLGEQPAELSGDIEFRDVTFAYPTRPDETVLKSFNLKIKAGETVAIVGESGCGKSTIVGLLERYYDPDGGQVLLDGRPLPSLNIQWLRRNISLVSQMPILFPLSIEKNIGMGKKDPTMDEIRAAAAMVCPWEQRVICSM